MLYNISVNIPKFIYVFYYRWTFGLFPVFIIIIVLLRINLCMTYAPHIYIFLVRERKYWVRGFVYMLLFRYWHTIFQNIWTNLNSHCNVGKLQLLHVLTKTCYYPLFLPTKKQTTEILPSIALNLRITLVKLKSL